MLYTYKRPDYVAKIPQCESMTDNYYHHVNNLGLKGVSELVYPEKPDHVPYADAFVLHYHAKQTDFLTTNAMNRLSSWLINERMLKILLCYRLPPHDIFAAWVEHRKKRYAYYILRTHFSYYEAIDFAQSSFFIINVTGKAIDRIRLNNADEYVSMHKNMPEKHKMKAHKLFFLPGRKIPYDLFRLQFASNDIFFNEKLVEEFIRQNITGIDFKSVPIPLYQHLTWADTGELVEECYCDYCKSNQNKI